MSTQEMIRIRGLRKAYGEHEVLRGIDFNVEASQVVVVIGPSGSGKSTLCAAATAWRWRRAAPSISAATTCSRMAGCCQAELNRLRMQVGMVFQGFNLFPHLSVLDNVTVGRARCAA